MSIFKTGRWNLEDIKRVEELIEQGVSYEEIEKVVHRPAATIQRMVQNKLLMNLSEEEKITKKAEITIKESAEWKEITQQLSKDEQEMFLHHWKEILAQFNNDVTHTERLQIIDIIRNEVLINRVMKKIHDANSDMGSIRNELVIEMSLEPEHRDTSKIIDLQRRSGDVGIAIGAYNREYKELMERKQKILVDIKGTREQRVKRLEDSKETITGWVAALISSPEMRNELGIYMEKFRIAQTVEYQRLADYHTYEDGQVQQPLLSSESIKEDNY